MRVPRPRPATGLVLLLLGLLVLTLARAADTPDSAGIRLEVDGAIGPATSDYLVRALARAEQEGAQMVVIRMDTPGGLVTSMREINKAILGSTVPVIVYVAPRGAHAASAGTYILYASHLAAMAPATNIGAATPVSIGGPGLMPGGDEDGGDDQGTMAHKALNDSVAYIRGLAEMRGRNADWAESAVREAATLTATQALDKGVIEIIASDLGDLLRQLDGREIEVQGRSITLDTEGRTLTPMSPDWRSRFLGVLTDPNIAYVLMLIGIYGIIFELANPGSVAPGVIGAISLILALFAFQVLPVDYAGLALMIFGVLLMVAEAFAPSFGILGIGGVVAFVIGSVIMMDTDVPGYGVSPVLIGTIAGVSSLVFTAVVVLAIRARRRPVVSGSEEIIGATALVERDFQGRGHVRLHGEVWQADSQMPVHTGQRVRVIGMEGLRLRVAPEEASPGEAPGVSTD